MNQEEFNTYKGTISDDYHDLTMDLISKYNILHSSTGRYERRLQISNFIVDYFVKDLHITATGAFEINILTYDEVIELSETLNKQLKTDYKPTFLTDTENYKSKTNGGF